MDFEKILHKEKNFAELDDADVEEFLRLRSFKTEHLNLEFKEQFPLKREGKFEIKTICKYIVGFSNEEGGLLVYGVSDNIQDSAVEFPAYIVGLSSHPSLEDLSQWVKERIHPLVTSPSIRFFQVAGKAVAILKIPPGSNKPYCYYEPPNNAVMYFKKTPGGIGELAPGEIREFHRTHVIDQAISVLRAAESQGLISSGMGTPQLINFQKHRDYIATKLESVTEFGFVGIYCWPVNSVDIQVSHLSEFIEQNRLRFSEPLRFYSEIDQLQGGVSVGYFPRSVRQDVKSTMRTTLYRNGLFAFDAQADALMHGNRGVHAGWFAYELQRHLQLSKALLAGFSVPRVHLLVDFAHIETFRISMDTYWDGHYSVHEPIHRVVDTSEIHDFDGEKRNIAVSSVRDIVGELYRIFGFSKASSPRLWDDDGYLRYVKGLENQR